MMKIQFKSDVKSPTVDIGQGPYRRSFKASEQPFEVSNEDWSLLQPEGLFEPAKEKNPPPPPSTDK
jgi:hypothetical protein